MQIEYHVLDAEGAHPVSVPVLRRLLQDGTQRPDDRFRVCVADPPVIRVLQPKDMAAFLDVLDQNPEAAVRLLADNGLRAAPTTLPSPASAPDKAVTDNGAPAPATERQAALEREPKPEPRPEPEPGSVSEADAKASPDRVAVSRSPAFSSEATAAQVSPSEAGPSPVLSSSDEPPAAPSSRLTGWRAFLAKRPMLLTFAALLALAALLFWPRDGDRALGRDNPGIAERDEEATPPEAATVAPEMFEARFVLLDTAAREGPDGTTAPVRQLTRGERVEVLASGGAEQAPEGWFRLQGGGYVVAEALRATAPPPLTRRLDEEMTLQSQTDIYNGPELAGPVQRTLARGQRVRVVGLVNQDVAEVRVGMDLGYAAYLSLLRREENPAALPPPQAQTSPRVWPPPQIPAPDARSPAGAGLVLGAADLVRAPSGEAMADYYPRRAFRERVEAQVAIQCNVIRSGRLTDCRVSRESTAGFGFGEATIRMAQETFRAPQRTRDGRPTEGAEFRATIRWRMS